MASIAQLRQLGRTQLNTQAAALEIDLLLAHVLQKSRTYLYTWPDATLSDVQLTRYQALLSLRQQGQPIAHLLGEREFWGLNFFCDNNSLIPRPDTETLVEQALDLLPATALVGADFGTGTGAIACALASERPAWQLLALDRIYAACRLAQRNQQALALPNVQVLQAFWGEAIKPASLDFIVSNPPYIAADDPHLDQGDVRFEPHSALVAGAQGYADFEQIIALAETLLKPAAYLIFEHGYQQGEGVRDRFNLAQWHEAQTVSDLGGNPRITWAQKR